jgi:hypothetical protein
MPPSSNPRNESCSQCGMANVGKEYHPYTLCLLVKARGGDTTAARQEFAQVIQVARSNDSWLRRRVDEFLKAVSKGA